LFKKIHVFRVKPDLELFSEISRYCKENNLVSGIVLGIIGSLRKATISYIYDLPAKYKSVDYDGLLEIVAAQGSIALNGNTPVIHIHIQVSCEEGCYGGHLAGATVYSTAEVVIGELDYQLRKKLDSYTGLNELMEK
jgi:predicted DNA-binding protein with PD1-like motif